MSEILKWEDKSPQWDNETISILDEGIKMNFNWISLNERLPEKNVRVLVCLNGDVFNNQIEIADLMEDEFWYFDSDWSNEFVSQFITHWMPLPSPPEVPDDNTANN